MDFKPPTMFLRFTVHFIDADFKLHSVHWKTLKVPQGHDAESLCGVLCSMLEDWKISDKVFCGTTDNGQNIVNAIGRTFPLYCSYTPQLAIMKALQVPKVHNTIARCKTLVEHFKNHQKNLQVV